MPILTKADIEEAGALIKCHLCNQMIAIGDEYNVALHESLEYIIIICKDCQELVELENDPT